MPKYEVCDGVMKTFEAENEDEAIQKFLNWLTGAGRNNIDIKEK